jgi:uncharacterized protein YndB with AHSA1/START domain
MAMAQTSEATSEATREAAVQPPPLKLSRTLHARPETVFKAWTAAEHVKRFFAPADLTVPHANVDPRVGGVFELCMRMPDGAEHWMRGVFVEVTPLRRLVIDMRVDDNGAPLFRALTEIDISGVLGGARIDVTQTYTLFDAVKAAPMVAGASQGWASTLDKLETEVVRVQGGSGTTSRSVVHATFHLERTYNAPASRVWRALTDPVAKAKWFGPKPDQWEVLERHMDVRVGGTERAKGRWESGMVSTFDAVYEDVIENQRLVYSYTMHLDDKKISVSLATLQLKAEGPRTTLMLTEQGAFLDGYDDAGSREEGTRHLLDALGASLMD